MPVDMKLIEGRREYKKLKKILDKIDADALKIIAKAENKTVAIERTVFLSSQLEDLLKEAKNIRKPPELEPGDLSGRGKCPPGTTFDPNTGTCV